MQLHVAWALRLYLAQSIRSIKCTDATCQSAQATQGIMFQRDVQINIWKRIKRPEMLDFYIMVLSTCTKMHTNTNLIWGNVYYLLLLNLNKYLRTLYFSFW